MKPKFVIPIVCCILVFITGACAPAPTPTLVPTSTLPPVPTDTPKPIAPPTNIPFPTVQPGKTRVREKDGMTQVKIEAGDFLMGSTDADLQAYPFEKPQHLVYLDEYWIDRTEVTVAMFKKFIAETGYRTDADKRGLSIVNEDANGYIYENGANWQYPFGPEKAEAVDDHPVVQISWNDAKAYCQWAGGRLPTEAEWEKAARGPDGRLYPWGNQPPAGNLASVCDVSVSADVNKEWCSTSFDDGFPFLAPVGSFPAGASPYGVLDMAGNAIEWVADWYDATYYTQDPPRNNPTGPAKSQLLTEHVVHGGSWWDPFDLLRSAFRYGFGPDLAALTTGFRCAGSP